MTSRSTIYLREECRRDGLAANFRMSAQTMRYLARAFPGNVIAGGYPAICSAEQTRCYTIAEALSSEDCEVAFVGHAQIDHLQVIYPIVQRAPNTSVTIWIPASDYACFRMLSMMPNSVLKLAIRALTWWKKHSEDIPIDVSLVDSLTQEKGLDTRLRHWIPALLAAGARRAILCDTRGQATCTRLKHQLKELREQDPDCLELHLHNDAEQAVRCTRIGLSLGVRRIGTAVYSLAERGTLCDPRRFLSDGLRFNEHAFKLFEQSYKKEVGTPEKVRSTVLARALILTGARLAMQGNVDGLVLGFGVTSNSAVAKALLGGQENRASDKMLMLAKNKLYSSSDRFYYNANELRRFLDDSCLYE